MRSVRSEEIMKILELADSLNLHRERITIPLLAEREGSVELQPDGRIRVVCPAEGSFEQ